MLRSTLITAAAVVLGCGATLARADHDSELRYVVGGALVGATLGEMVYVSGHRDYHPYRHAWRHRHGFGRFGHGYGRFDPWRRGYGHFNDFYPSRRHFAGRFLYDRPYWHHRHRRGFCRH